MKVRKIVAGLAAVSMMAAFSAQAVLAAETVTISADKVTADVGATFTMNVELSGVPAAGISVCEFALTYDSALVTVKDVTVGAIADKGADGAEQFEGATAFESDYSTAGVINVTYTTGLDDSAYWITEDGVMLTIKGTVSAEAADGASTEFAIGAIQRETAEGSGVTNTEISIGNVGADYTVTKYEAAVENGSVTVKAEGNTDDTQDSSGGGEVVYGDVNCDGKVSIADVLTLNKNLMAGEALDPQGILNADVDKDGSPTSADALNILKYTIMILDTLPV
jgi:hypothetical protein